MGLSCACQRVEQHPGPYALLVSMAHPPAPRRDNQKSLLTLLLPLVESHCLPELRGITQVKVIHYKSLRREPGRVPAFAGSYYYQAFAHAVPAAWGTIPFFLACPTPTFRADFANHLQPCSDTLGHDL